MDNPVFTWTTLQNNRIYIDNPVKNLYLHGQLCKTLVFTWTTIWNTRIYMENPLKNTCIYMDNPVKHP